MVLALVALWVTVLSGVAALAFWFPTDRQRWHVRMTACLAHVSLAFVAVIAWTAFAVGRREALGATSVSMLGAAVVAGILTVTLTRRWEHRSRASAHAVVPFAVLAVHGVVAAAAVTAVVVAFVRS